MRSHWSNWLPEPSINAPSPPLVQAVGGDEFNVVVHILVNQINVVSERACQFRNRRDAQWIATGHSTQRVVSRVGFDAYDVRRQCAIVSVPVSFCWSDARLLREGAKELPLFSIGKRRLCWTVCICHYSLLV